MSHRSGWLAVCLALTLLLAVSACGQDRQDASPTAASPPAESQAARVLTSGPTSSTLDPAQVASEVRSVADWALREPAPFDPEYWAMAPLYDGLIDATLSTGDPRYMAAVIKAGRCVLFEAGSRTYHADGHAAGRSWLRLYDASEPKDPALLEPWVELFDQIVSRPIRDDFSFLQSPPPGVSVTDRWTWTDALYMAPPTIVILADLTGDERYLRFMDSEYRFAYEELFDPVADLFYRDARYIDERSDNGERVYWSRGNGWVYAGLALVLETLPSDWPNRPFYIDLLQRMSPALLEAQQPDGSWHPNLADPADPNMPETSGTALFTMGMASAVHQGFIDGETYWPAIERAWASILSATDADGAVNFVQPPASVPQPFDPATRVPYGTGAVLGAGARILVALEARPELDATRLYKEARALEPEAPQLWDAPDFRCG